MSQTQSQLNMGRVKLGDLKEVAKLEFLDLLDQFPGGKALIWDPTLTGPMGLIAEYSILKEHQVHKMYSLNLDSLPPACSENVVFITRPVLSNMDIISDYIKREERSGGAGVRPEYHVVFVPKEAKLCEKRLIQAGVLGSVKLHSLPVYLFPLDTDLLSMELASSYRDCVSGDTTSLHYTASALTRLQAITGVIPRIYGKGTAAIQVFDFMVRMKKEASGQEPAVRSQIDTLVIIDRAVDLISPLPTQLTYEGLVDEMFGIQCGSVSLGEPEKKVISLSSQEELYQELRGLNFNAVGPTLSRKAKYISAQVAEKNEARTVRELKQFVDKLPGMQTAKQSLTTHTSLAEMVKERIDSEEFLSVLELEQRLLTGAGEGGRYLEEVEDLACSNTVPVTRLLRLICLQSVVCGGLKQKVLESYKRLLLEEYGYELLLSLDTLCDAGLLTPMVSSKRSNYSVFSKRLGIIKDNVDEQNPHDIAYVHSVYGPLSVRLVINCLSPGWRNIRDVLDMVPGPSFEDTQQVSKQLAGRNKKDDKKVVLVFFVGGATMAEVAALRFLTQQEESNVEYIIATTNIITGTSFIESLYSKLEAPAF